MTWSRLDLGVGVIAAGGVDLVWPDIAPLVDVVEVEPQTLWDHRRGAGQQIDPVALHWLRSLDRPLLSHGVGFPVGGTVPPESRGVQASARSAGDLDAIHWSEHLSFNRAGPAQQYAGYLLPPIPTSESVDAAVSHIARFQEQFARPFLVETPTSYLRPVEGDLTDGQFVAEIAERADCGILLDLHNIWANEINGRQPVDDFLSEIPLDRVWEMHLAGGFYLDSYYLDAHVGGVSPRLLDLAARVIPALPRVRAILFEAVQESVNELGADGLANVLQDMRTLAAMPECPTPETPRDVRRDRPAAALHPTTADRETQLLEYTTRASATPPGSDPGASVLRYLTDHARLSLLVENYAPQLKQMLLAHGRDGTDALLEQFLSATPASAWPAEQCAAFGAWLEDNLGLTA